MTQTQHPERIASNPRHLFAARIAIYARAAAGDSASLDVAGYLRDRHPSWDTLVLDRVLSSVVGVTL